MSKPPKVRIYTRSGDTGQTALFGGRRLSKDNIRIEAYGTVDELNSSLGVASSFIKDKKITKIINEIQNDLFDIGAELSNPSQIGDGVKKIFYLSKSKSENLEKIIDELDKNLPPLKNFILPKGTNAAGLLQLSRSITRRAERRVVTLARKEKVNPNILSYLNRLSDLLFVASRYFNKKAKVKESPWNK